LAVLLEVEEGEALGEALVVVWLGVGFALAPEGVGLCLGWGAEQHHFGRGFWFISFVEVVRDIEGARVQDW
jgi:hypothetical protein